MKTIKWTDRLTSDRDKGFTRVDLIATATVTGLIALMAHASIASAGRQNSQVLCLDNLRQLMQAWTAHAADHEGTIVSATHWAGGQWLTLPATTPEQINPFAPQGISNSPLWPYGADNKDIWRCPDDPTTGSHPDYQGGLPAPRVRSYAMNGWAGETAWAGQTEWKLYRKLDDFTLPGPSGTFILIGERPESIDDGYFAVDMHGFNPAFAENPQARIVDYPATYHSGGASLAYADGRAEVKVWEDPRTVPTGTKKNILSPGNPDIYWLQSRATRRIVEAHALRFGSSQMLPQNLRVGIHLRDNAAYDLETSDDLVNWRPAGEVPAGEGAALEISVNQDAGQQFFRARKR